MLTGLLIILILFAALVYSGKVARPAWAQTSPMTLGEFADKRQTLRTLTNTIRERKCQPPVRSFKTPAWKVKHRVWNLSYWRGHYRDARELKSRCPVTPWYVTKQIWAGNILGRESAGDPWPNCPDPWDGSGSSWQGTVNCENGGQWADSPGFYRCGLQFHPDWELRFGRLCP